MTKVKLFIQTHKRWLIIAAAVLLVISGYAYYRHTAWERYFTVEYIGSTKQVTLADTPATVYTYKITNNTNRPFKEIKVVFKCSDLFKKKWKYKKTIYDIKPGQTVELEVYKHVMDMALGEEPFYPNYDFYKIEL